MGTDMKGPCRRTCGPAVSMKDEKDPNSCFGHSPKASNETRLKSRVVVKAADEVELLKAH